LKEAANIVGIKLFDVKREILGNCVLNVKKIKWNDSQESSFNYIDLSSVDRENHSIYNTDLVTMQNAPSRAQQIVHTEDVLFGTTRPLLQRYCIVPNQYDEQICSTGFCVLRANKEKILPKWILYGISTNLFLSHIEKYEKGTSYPAISDKDVKLYEIPLPSLPVQEYIVSILDKFDALINDVSKGIPKEIELRQKQYEYYREKLLDFKRSN
jgi:restriction modification system DNA specificity domain protein